MHHHGYLVDRATQKWVQATGRLVSFDEHPWLLGPVGGPRLIAGEWVKAQAQVLGGTLAEVGGLLEHMSDLGGDGFDPSALARPVIDFYERTAEWRMEVSSRWSPFAWPIGLLLSSLFAQRLQQLSLPLGRTDIAYEMESRVTIVRGQNGKQLAAAWLRTLRTTGQTVYSGWYGTATLPEAGRPSLRVVFPLPNGNLTVFLRPEVREDGALVMTSPIGPFGTEGAYLLVAQPNGRTGWARRVPLAERFIVGLDDEGILRTDHSLSLWQIPVVKLRYLLERPSEQSTLRPHRCPNGM